MRKSVKRKTWDNRPEQYLEKKNSFVKKKSNSSYIFIRKKMCPLDYTRFKDPTSQIKWTL